MPITGVLVFHILAGTVGLAAGFTALFSRKGAPLHRTAGKAFAITMLSAGASAIYLAVFTPEKMVSVIGGAMAFYLVATAWITVRRKPKQTRPVDWALIMIPLAACSAALLLASEAAQSAGGTRDGLPPGAYYFWASIAALCIVLDVGVLVRGGVAGSARIARHLWRMCFAMFVAEAALLLGQQHVFPEALRQPYFLFAPLVIVLGLMLFWLARAWSTPRVNTCDSSRSEDPAAYE